MYLRGAVIGLAFGMVGAFHVDNAAHIGGLAAGFGDRLPRGHSRPGSHGRENLARRRLVLPPDDSREFPEDVLVVCRNTQ